MTRLSLQLKVFVNGGLFWDGIIIKVPESCSCVQMEGGAMAAGIVPGNTLFNNGLTSAAWKSASAITLLGPASGTRSSIACFHLSVSTGEGSLLSAMRPSLI